MSGRSADAFLVNEADAAVVVWKAPDPEVAKVLALVERKGMPVRVIGAPERKPKARRKSEPEPSRREGMLPD